MCKKKIFAFLLLVCISFTAFSQTGTFKKSVPPFYIELTNSKHLQPTDLQKNKPLMLIYFSPTCEHCKEFTKKMLDSMENLGNIQIVMITYLSAQDIAKFETEFSLNKYPNIFAGTEGYRFTVQKYYSIKTFPFLALFNSKAQLTNAYRVVPSINELCEQIKKM